MVLKLSLKPGERIAINGAEISVGDQAGELAIHNHARILRENEFLSVEQVRNALAAPNEFGSPETWLYYLMQMIYFQPGHAELHLGKVPEAVQKAAEASPDKVEAVNKVQALVDEGEVFLAMRELREAFPSCVTLEEK